MIMVQDQDSDIVWQLIFINMKILKILKEQEQTIDGGTYGYTVDTLNKIEESIKSAGSFVFSNTTIHHPTNNYRFIPTLHVSRGSETEIRLAVKIYLIVESFEIPTDFLIFVTDWYMDLFKEKIPDLEEMLNDSRFLKGSIHYSFSDIFIAKKDVFFTLDDYMDIMYYNARIRRVHPLEELFNKQKVNEVYTLDPSQVPTFSEDFSVATSQVEKKIKNIYKGFRKGTFKGHQYEYKEDNPRISILVDKQDYDPSTKVIHPKFKIRVNAGYVLIDGKPTSTFEPEQNRYSNFEFVKEFNDYIKSRFKQFGIEIL